MNVQACTGGVAIGSDNLLSIPKVMGPGGLEGGLACKVHSCAELEVYTVAPGSAGH